MNKQLLKLHAERARLQERITQQRFELGMQLIPAKNASDAVNRLLVAGQGGLNFVRRNPLLLLAAMVVVFVLRPKGSLRLVQKGVFVWRSWRELRRLVPPAVLAPILAPIYKFIWQRFASR